MREGESETGKYIAVVRDASETFACNALRFETAEAARNYASDLSLRWLAVRSYAVIPYDTPKDSGGSYWTREAIEKAAIGSIVDY